MRVIEFGWFHSVRRRKAQGQVTMNAALEACGPVPPIQGATVKKCGIGRMTVDTDGRQQDLSAGRIPMHVGNGQQPAFRG